MDNEQTGKITDDYGNDSKEDSLWSMARDFYNMRMLPVIIVVWAYSIILIVLSIFSAVRFFRSELVKDQIMYAAIFICCVQFIVLMKLFSWQMIHRNNIKRQINRLARRLTNSAV